MWIHTETDNLINTDLVVEISIVGPGHEATRTKLVAATTTGEHINLTHYRPQQECQLILNIIYSQITLGRTTYKIPSTGEATPI